MGPIRKQIKKFISLLTIAYLSLKSKHVISFHSFLWKSTIKVNKNCTIFNSPIELSNILVENGNNVKIFDSKIMNSKIKILGQNNILELHGVRVFSNVDLLIRGEGCKIRIDKNTTFGGACIICMGENTSIDIGADCMFSWNIDIWASDTHPIVNEEGEIINRSESIKIGEHVWVGKNVTILKGVDIGRNAIVGMNSIVTKNIQPSTINVGNPTKVIRDKVSWKREHIDV